MMIMFQILGQYDQTDSHDIDGAAEEPKRRLWIHNDFYTPFSNTW
jgi:hypothetical protein